MSDFEFLRLKKRSLSWSLSISLILIVIIVESAILGFIYTRQARLLFRELNNNADDQATNSGEILSIPIWDFDDEQIAKVGKGFLNKNIIDEIHIQDQHGQTLFRSSANSINEDYIERTVDVTYEEQIIGRVMLRFSMQPFQMELRRLQTPLFMRYRHPFW